MVERQGAPTQWNTILQHGIHPAYFANVQAYKVVMYRGQITG